MSSWPSRQSPSVRSSDHQHSPTSPTSPHSTYESFRDLVPSPNTTPIHSRRLFSHRRIPISPTAAPWDRAREAPPPTTAEASEGVDKLLKTSEMVLLTVGLAGAQLTWTVEMAFGTPYLLSLGLSKEATSLVWLAGPVSGLLVQPLIGALSDSTPPPYRRRLYIVLTATLVVTATILTAFAMDIAEFMLALRGLGDWDPNGKESIRKWGITLAVVGFWGMDFGLNGVQAGLRALILDKTPLEQYATSNAYHGRMTHIGNLLGYTLGYLPLAMSPALAWLGGGQFRRLACLSCVLLIACVGVTCSTQDEVERPGRAFPTGDAGVLAIWKGIREGIRDLSKEVKRVCIVQFFAWTAFFPFLFYSTTYIAQMRPASEDREAATRLGSLSLLFFSIVALVTGIILPALTTLAQDFPSVTKWPRLSRWFLSKITPRNCWTFGLLWFAGCMVATFAVRDVHGAMSIVACCGVSWAIACWVPFALVMESIRTSSLPKPSDLLPSSPDSSPSSSPPISPPALTPTKTSPQLPFRASLPRLPPNQTPSETTLLLPPASAAQTNDSGIARRELRRRPPSPAGGRREKEGGGTTLGLHNLSIVAPQFFVALVAAGIFRMLDGKGGGGEDVGATNDVVWVLRFGGLAALGGAVASRWVLKTGTEVRYVQLLKGAPRPLLGEDDIEE